MIPDALVPADVHPAAGVYCPSESKYSLQFTHRHFAGSGVGMYPLANRWGINATAAMFLELVH